MGNKAIYKFGASDTAYQDLRGNNLVMWEAIKRCARDGCESADFGRTSVTNEGLRRFKLGWGATERTIEYFKYDLRKRSFVTDSDKASGWHNLVFRSMPPFVSRLAGTFLYKHLG
jgi:lipid II:glycine glycyltransferase (peptidoglycan interpeptide bridge formation enzyme)